MLSSISYWVRRFQEILEGLISPRSDFGFHQAVKEKKNQRWAIRREVEPVGPTLLKNHLAAGWGLPCSG